MRQFKRFFVACVLITQLDAMVEVDTKQLARRLMQLENALNVLAIEITAPGKKVPPPVIPIETPEEKLARLEREKKAQEELQRIEQERKAQAEKIRQEIERQREEARERAEKEKKEKEVPALKKGTPELIQARWMDELGDIKQLKVLQQEDMANCGYHALKNGILILNAILAGSNNEERKIYLNDLTSAPIYHDWFSTWAPIIKKKRGSTDWLMGNEIELLIKSDFPKNVEHRDAFFTVIDNPEWLAQKGFGVSLLEEIIATIEDFQKNENFSHIFLLANANEYLNKEGYTRGTTNHWITVAVNKVKGQSQFIILDSANSPRKEQRDVQSLVNTLLKGNIEELRLKNSQIPGNLDTIRSYVEFLSGESKTFKGTPADAVEGIIIRANDIIEDSQKNLWINKPIFKPYKEELKQLLTRAISATIVSHFKDVQQGNIDLLQNLLKGLG
jgi:hypothetical protein